MLLNKELQLFIEKLGKPLENDRQLLAEKLAQHITEELKSGRTPKLNFICTHNSRRSHFAQIWAHTFSRYFDIKIEAYSGGVEVTSMNERVADSLIRSGFNIVKGSGDNPEYSISYSREESPILCWSKHYSDAHNPQADYAAIMVCSSAEKACPFIPEASFRMALTFEDPKEFDGSDIESKMYDERSSEIANELYRVFQIVSNEH